jgi:hypothetical protein
MWRCPDCGRTFRRQAQPHSCRTMNLEDRLPHDHVMRPVFDCLRHRLTSAVGACDVVALPCCIHLVGEHDFVAVLPRRDRLEVRFALPLELDSRRVKRSAQIARSSWKHSVDITADDDVDDELLGWLHQAHEAQESHTAA